jgi:ADP-ribosylglycohydrolase
MPTQMLRREQVVQRWGRITRFEDGPPDNEIAPGVPAGRVTDDTDQAVILGELLVAGAGELDLDEYAGRLVAWQDAMVATGSLDLLGPSTLKALTAYRAGVPATQTGRWGDTNGAAMRVAPIGVMCPPSPLRELVETVARVDALTHDTGIANAGACAVAAAVSAGVAGASVADAATVAVDAARAGAAYGSFVPGADVACRIAWAVDLVEGAQDDDAGLDVVVDLVGTSVATQEAVPAAFAIVARFGDDAWGACCAAASLGGDSDTIAAMVGAVLGARHGASAFPGWAVAALEAANPTLALRELSEALVALRRPA